MSILIGTQLLCVPQARRNSHTISVVSSLSVFGIKLHLFSFISLIRLL
nr:MAG TPA: hypothetical protein [Caudoviricetes sp.]